MKQQKNIKKYAVRFIISVMVIIFLSILTAYLFTLPTSNDKLNQNKLSVYKPSLSFYDFNGNNITKEFISKNNYISLKALPEYVPKAFISVEDKRFYNHNGIDYIRILSAIKNNIKAGEFLEGASTISQQLIKNTHLTNEKTIKRKIKEIRLTRLLEKKYSKPEILELYLNVIYFGMGAYGIENAANIYFSKSAENLTVAETAALVAAIKAPAEYSPSKFTEKAINRRNSVLNILYTNKIINKNEFNTAKKEGYILNYSEKQYDDYLNCALDEAKEILNCNDLQLRNSNIKIVTYLDCEKQNYLYKALKNKDYYLKNKYGNTYDGAAMLCDNNSAGITAYYKTSPFFNIDTKLQSGSVIKPIAVYGPALQDNLITPITPIKDEKITFGDYSPSNYNEQYYGWVSAKTCLAKSLNIPAVSIYNSLNKENVLKYTSAMNIDITEDINSLSVALGGVKNGFSIKNLTSAYSAFANDGNYNNIKFVKEIRDENNNIIYSHTKEDKKVFSAETAFLLTDMLKECAINGTAKNIGIDGIASKTGTSGDENGNVSAWNISYSKNYTLSVWLGNCIGGKEYNLPSNVTGGNHSTKIASEILKKIKNLNTSFTKPEGVIELNIDKVIFENEHKLELSNNYLNKNEIIKVYFNENNIPTVTSKRNLKFSSPEINITISDNIPIIEIKGEKNIKYTMQNSTTGEELIKNRGIEGNIIIRDKKAEKGKINIYKLTLSNDYTETTFEYKIIVPIEFNSSNNPSDKKPDKIAADEWWWF